MQNLTVTAKAVEASAFDEAQREMQGQMLNDYCRKVDDELCETEERVIPNAAFWMGISWLVTFFAILVSVLWL